MNQPNCNGRPRSSRYDYEEGNENERVRLRTLPRSAPVLGPSNADRFQRRANFQSSFTIGHCCARGRARSGSLTHCPIVVRAVFFVLALLPATTSASDAPGVSPELLNPRVEAVECRTRAGLPNFFDKLKQGSEVRIAYLGGSITEQEGWRPKSLGWFQKQYPQAKVSQINAAIGGTGSDLGVFRLQHDVLDHRPDLLFVEFAVNDGGASPLQIYRCMEGIVRQTWKANPSTDTCFVYTVAGNMVETLQEGFFPRSASAMDKLADFYGIPSIQLGLEVARLVKAGKVIFKGEKPKTQVDKAALAGKILFSPDAVHPYVDTGHELYLEALVRAMSQIATVGKPGAHAAGQPLVRDNWEAAKMIPLDGTFLSAGWQKLDPAQNNLARRFQNRLPCLWKANQPGDAITFKFRGTLAGIYDLLGPDCGQVVISVDDRPPVVRPRFDSFCTYHRLGQLFVANELPDGLHQVKLTIHPEQPDKPKILSQRGEKMDNPKRFADRAWYAGAILLIGELAAER